MAWNRSNTPSGWGHQRIQSLEGFAKKHRVVPKKIKRAKPVNVPKSKRTFKFRATKGTSYHPPRKTFYVEFRRKLKGAQFQRVGKSRTVGGANKIVQRSAPGSPPGTYRIVYAVEGVVSTLSIRR